MGEIMGLTPFKMSEQKGLYYYIKRGEKKRDLSQSSRLISPKITKVHQTSNSLKKKKYSYEQNMKEKLIIITNVKPVDPAL